MEKGNSSNFRIGWDRGVLVPVAFKLDHLHSIKPILVWRFFNFSTFILGSPILLPQIANNGKGHSPNFRIGWDRRVSVPGAFKLDHLHSIEPILVWRFFNFFTFILGRPILLPRGLIMEEGNSSNFRIGWDRGVWVPGAFKLDHLNPVEPLLFW